MAAPNYTKIDVDRIVFEAASITNAARSSTPNTYPTTDNAITDPLRPVLDFRNACKTIDAFIVGSIKDNLNHRLRPLFYIQTEYSNGDLIYNVMTGTIAIKIGSTYYLGKEVTADYLTQLQQNVLSLDTSKGYYSLGQTPAGTSIFYTGDKARLDILDIPVGTIAFPLTPIEYELPVLWGVLATVFPKDGKFVEAANHFGNLWAKTQELISKGAEMSAFPKG